MIVKTLAELAEPDLASLVIRPLDIDPAKIAEGVAEYRQRQVASFELVDAVPDSTRMSYERIRRIYSYGVLDYDLYTVAGNQARLVVEQALRDRFLPFYGGTPVFIDGKGGEHPVLAGRFGDLYDADRPLVRKSWRLKIQSGRHPIPFNGMLSSLLRWARAEGLLGGQRDRWQDKFRIRFRNYTAHSEYHREMPDDAAAEIFHLAQLINRLWGAPGETPIRREVVAIAWSATATSYGLAEHFRIDDRMPADATCAVILADPQDLTLGDSFDAQYEMTAMPYQFLWGPGTWAEGAEWVKRQQPVADEIATVDRLFLLRYHDRRLYMPRSIGSTAALADGERAGTWCLLRADYPGDAFGHQRHLLQKAPDYSTTGFCRECPAESIAAGTWQQIIDRCAALGADVTPRSAPDIRASMCRTPRWNDLTEDGQWVFQLG